MGNAVRSYCQRNATTTGLRVEGVQTSQPVAPKRGRTATPMPPLELAHLLLCQCGTAVACLRRCEASSSHQRSARSSGQELPYQPSRVSVDGAVYRSMARRPGLGAVNVQHSAQHMSSLLQHISVSDKQAGQPQAVSNGTCWTLSGPVRMKPPEET